jgi:hypothetical protein
MAAELFRARYAEEPFVSLFVTGCAGDKKLHTFTNCERISIKRDNAPSIDLEGALHHEVDLEGDFTELSVEGDRRGGAVVETLLMWSEAETANIEATVRPFPGTTVPVDLTVVDRAGTPVRDWNGHVTVEVDGDARLLSYTDTGAVFVARGQGRTYLEVGRSGGVIVIRAIADGLEAGTATIE